MYTELRVAERDEITSLRRETMGETVFKLSRSLSQVELGGAFPIKQSLATVDTHSGVVHSDTP